ncbi:MAG: outer membrane beta-barrel protein [Bacteroidetes bacterium]|nr:outer membrane beta-barrel protein [Bacteroidota bacterium]
MMTKIKFKEMLLLLVGGFSLQVANAQEEADKGTFTFNGFADVNYFYNVNAPASGSNTGASGFARAFDQKSNQFQLGMVQGKMTYVYKKSTVVADMTFGPFGDLGNYGNVVGSVPGSSTSLAIKQLYITHAFSDKFAVTAGQFGTHVGYEVIDAPLNFNYSLSNLFNNGPFYHIGLKADYAVSDKVFLMAGIVNNWDNLYDNNKYKSAIAQVKIVASDKATMYFNYIGGNEAPQASFGATDSLKNFKQLIDYVLNYQVTDKFYVGLNGVLGRASMFSTPKNDSLVSMHWGGAAVYMNYVVNDMFTLGARADYFDNTEGAMYIGNTQVQSYTLTGKISLADGNLMFKPEVRMDMYGNNQFEDKDGAFTKKSQITVGAGAIYKF